MPLTLEFVAHAITGVHLPGHTLGHCGFYSARHDLLFSGDLFASYFFRGGVLPPSILNSAPELIWPSLKRAQAMNVRFMVPQHYDVLSGALHRRRFDELMERLEWRHGRRAVV